MSALLGDGFVDSRVTAEMCDKSQVKEYMLVRGATRVGGLDQARRECLDRGRWRWRDRVKQYMCERGATRGGGLDQARRECLDRERWRLFCRGHPLGGRSRRERGVRAIDR